MNKIYRLVWNEMTQTWTAAAEIARDRGKSTNPRKMLALLLMAGMGAISAGEAEAWIVDPGIVRNGGTAYLQTAATDNGIESNTAIGTGAQTTTDEDGMSTALGDLAQATAVGSTAIGAQANASAENALAAGMGAQAGASDSIAMGTNATASGANSIALGRNSIASDSDAIAIGQYAHSAGGGISIGQETWSGMSSVAIGSNTYATGDESTAVGVWARANDANATAVGARANAFAGATSIGRDSGAYADSAVSVGAGATVAFFADNAAALGSFSLAYNPNDVALGAGSVTDTTVATTGVTLRGHNYSFAGTSPTSTVSVGTVGNERTITNVAAGRLNPDSTDAVNGSQLFATNQAVESINSNIDNLGQGSVKYDTNEDGTVNFNSITLGGDTYNSVTKTGGTRITNVANGSAPSDAVNFSQLTETNNNVTNLANTVNNITNGVSSRYFHANSTGADSVAIGQDAVAIGVGAVTSADNSVALGAGSSASRGATTGYTDGTGNLANQNAVGEVSVGSAGAERQITNVAAGSSGTDAVNVAQLNAALQNISYGTNPSSDVGGNNMFQVSNDYNTLAAQATGAQSVAGGSNAIASGDNANAVGDNAQATGSDSTAMGNKAKATGNKSTAIGNNAVSSGDNSVALGSGSNDGGRSNVVSVSTAGNERTIINVAPGEVSATSTDAVNGSQLNATNNNVTTLSNDIKSIQGDIVNLDHKMSAGVAAAMATAGLPQAYRPGASMMALGGATWKGESALSVGLSTITDNGKWVIKATGNSSSRGNSGASVGAGYQF
ncbi:YadA-like family protein [Silvimonas sp.]|uniref:YadA-like family protein n=1 Tax=Silvimonas sp. TaxID=2650811 RepID=UPI00284C7E96|nr:YadA-like family protein [Silvimonas sp.]MDR3427550.1 YadA-like family protein [Silvimonas sp.]